MIYKEKAFFWDFLLLTLTLPFNFLDEDLYSVSVQTVVIVAYLLLRFRPTPLNPFFFLAPSSVYLLVGVSYLYLFPMEGTTRFFTAAAIGLVAFSMTLRFTYHVSQGKYVGRLIRPKLIIQIYLLAITLTFSPIFIGRFSGFELLSTVLTLSLRPTLSAIILGSIAAVATRSAGKSFVLLLLYSIFIAIQNINSNDLSRLSIVDLFIFSAVALFFAYRPTGSSLFFGSKLVSLFFLFPVIFGFSYVLIYGSNQNFGGDWLIVRNAIEVMDATDGHHEPFMPFFNSFFIFLPDFFWFSEKPTNYNPSAWYISSVLNSDPEIYPWGVGVTLFGAGYLYGGYLGVALIFSVIAMFLSWIAKHITNPFWVGFTLYFFLRLPYSFFRMDETFLFGSLIPTVFAIYTFRRIFQRRINRCFLT